MEPCPICFSEMTHSAVRGTGMINVICTRCGSYRISTEAIEEIRNMSLSPRQISNASSWLFENQGFEIYLKNIDRLKAISPPSFHDRADKILTCLEKHTEYAGHYIRKNDSWLTWGWCVNDTELYEILKYLQTAPARIELTHDGSVEKQLYKISPHGWKRLEEINEQNKASAQGFVAMWFDKTMEDIYFSTISEGISEAGYKPHKVDQREHNDKIDDEIISQIRRSRFILADFTGHRGGVYYEAGFARGLGLEVIWTCNADDLDNLHFDIRQYNCIIWEKTKLTDFKSKIKNRIESVIGKGPYSN